MALPVDLVWLLLEVYVLVRVPVKPLTVDPKLLLKTVLMVPLPPLVTMLPTLLTRLRYLPTWSLLAPPPLRLLSTRRRTRTPRRLSSPPPRLTTPEVLPEQVPLTDPLNPLQDPLNALTRLRNCRTCPLPPPLRTPVTVLVKDAMILTVVLVDVLSGLNTELVPVLPTVESIALTVISKFLVTLLNILLNELLSPENALERNRLARTTLSTFLLTLVKFLPNPPVLPLEVNIPPRLPEIPPKEALTRLVLWWIPVTLLPTVPNRLGDP